MNIRDRLGSVFAFNTIPTTVLLVLVYAVILSTVLITDNLPSVPKDTRGLNLDQAWWDLHRASHPYKFIPSNVDLSSQGVCQTSYFQLACQRPRP